jgi:hypothetical protein
MEKPEESPAEAAAEEETRWTDDRIRWEKDFAKQDQKKQEDKEEEEEEECAFIDPFKDPDPFHTFEFDFDVIQEECVHIELRGYKTGADEVWQSTGLTLWRASEHLCKYMAAHPELFRGNRVLEVSWIIFYGSFWTRGIDFLKFKYLQILHI